MSEVGSHRLSQMDEDVSPLLAARLDDGQDGGDESASVAALRAERQLPPDHRVAQGALADVVGEFYSFDLQKRPEPLAVCIQFLAHAHHFAVSAEPSAQQQAFHFKADRLHQTLHFDKRDGAVATARPMSKEFLRAAHKVVPEALHLPIRVIDQCLKVPLQVCPTPLQFPLFPRFPIHLGAVAVDHPIKHIGQQFVENCRRPSGSQGKKRVHGGDKRPQPSLGFAFLGGRFVNSQDGLSRQALSKLLIAWRHGSRRLLLELYDPARRTGLIQNRLQEQGDPPLALSEAAHQERCQCHQPRAGLAGRHARGQLSASARLTAGTRKSMQLIFRDRRLDLRNFRDLMPQWFRIAAEERITTAPTTFRFQGDDGLTFLGRNQRALVLGMSRLATRFLLGFLLVSRRFGVRMFRAGRQRGIPWSLLQGGNFGFENLDPLFIMVDHRLQQRLKFRRQGSELLGGNRGFRQRHCSDVADFAFCAKPNLHAPDRPGCDRLR